MKHFQDNRRCLIQSYRLVQRWKTSRPINSTADAWTPVSRSDWGRRNNDHSSTLLHSARLDDHRNILTHSARQCIYTFLMHQIKYWKSNVWCAWSGMLTAGQHANFAVPPNGESPSNPYTPNIGCEIFLCRTGGHSLVGITSGIFWWADMTFGGCRLKY